MVGEELRPTISLVGLLQLDAFVTPPFVWRKAVTQKARGAPQIFMCIWHFDHA